MINGKEKKNLFMLRTGYRWTSGCVILCKNGPSQHPHQPCSFYFENGIGFFEKFDLVGARTGTTCNFY